MSSTYSLSPVSTMSSLSPASMMSSGGSRFPSPVSMAGNNDHAAADSRHTSPAYTGSTPGLSRSSTPATTPAPSSDPCSEIKTVSKRGQPPNHIKRPANAYICFRSEFCKSKPPQLERHNANVSIITGLAWRQLGAEGQRPYREMADRKKAEFTMMYPDWVFRPRQNLPPKKQRKKQTRTDIDQERYLDIASEYSSGKRGKELQEYPEAIGSTPTDSDSSPRPRPARKASKSKRLSAKARAQLAAAELIYPADPAGESTSRPQPSVSTSAPIYEPMHASTLALVSPPIGSQVPLPVEGHGEYHTVSAIAGICSIVNLTQRLCLFRIFQNLCTIAHRFPLSATS